MAYGQPYPPPPGAPPTGYPYPGYSQVDTPTVKGLLYMLIAGILIIVGDFTCFVLSLIGWILAIVGFLKIYGDRHSYPEPHPTNVRQSLILYILGIIITIVGVIVIVVATFGMIFSAIGESGSFSDAFNNFLIYLIISIVIISVGSILVIIGRYKLLVELVPPDRRGFLKFAVIISIIIMIAGIISLPYFFINLEGTFENIESNEEPSEEEKFDVSNDISKFQEKTWLMSTLNTISGLISQILFLLCFYFAYDYQKKNPQLRKEVVLPPGLPPPPSYYPPPPPGYYPPPPHY